MELKWTEGFTIRVSAEKGTASISANREGLLSLAEQIKALACEKEGSHIH